MISLKSRIILIVGIGCFSAVFYLRFIRERYSGELLYSDMRIVSYLITIIFFAVSLIAVLRGIVNSESLFARCVGRFNSRYNTFCYTLITFCVETMPGPYVSLGDYLISKFVKYNIQKTRTIKMIVHVGILLPRVILPISLLCDVLINNAITFYPKVTLIMLVPLLIKITVFYLQELCGDKVAGIQQFLEITENPDDPPGVLTVRLRPDARINYPTLSALTDNPSMLEGFVEDNYTYSVLYKRFRYFFEVVSSVNIYYNVVALVMWIIAFSLIIIKTVFV
jgi:hypothetical protein